MCSSALVRQLVKEKENSEFKPVKLRLKFDLVSYPARAEGLVNMYISYMYIFWFDNFNVNPRGVACIYAIFTYIYILYIYIWEVCFMVRMFPLDLACHKKYLQCCKTTK